MTHAKRLKAAVLAGTLLALLQVEVRESFAGEIPPRDLPLRVTVLDQQKPLWRLEITHQGERYNLLLENIDSEGARSSVQGVYDLNAIKDLISIVDTKENPLSSWVSDSVCVNVRQYQVVFAGKKLMFCSSAAFTAILDQFQMSAQFLLRDAKPGQPAVKATAASQP